MFLFVLGLIFIVLSIFLFAEKILYKFVWKNRISKFDDKNILITGCDTGFGNGSAILLAKKGFKVFAGCLTEQGIKELEALNIPTLKPVKLDVSDEKSVIQAVQQIKSQVSSLWAVINNAGIYRIGAFDILTTDEWRLTFNVNVLGIYYVSKHCIGLLRAVPNSRLINVASIAGRIALPTQSAYSASKFAVEGMSDSWRRELKQWGVRVVLIEPGVMKTPLYAHMQQDLVDKTWNSMTTDVQELYGKDFLRQYIERTSEFVQKRGGDPQLVVEAYADAVELETPPSRMPIGKDIPFWLLPSLLPWCYGDMFFNMLSRNRALPAALQTKKQ